MDTLYTVPGFEHLQVTEDGRVFNTRTGNWIKGSLSGRDKRYYVQAGYGRKGQHKVAVHRLMALTFYGERPEGKEVRHLDGNRLNNHKDNLRYGTRSENQQDSVKHGTCGQAKLKPEEIKDIRWLYSMGWLQREIAEAYGLCQQNVSHIVRNNTWKESNGNT